MVLLKKKKNPLPPQTTRREVAMTLPSTMNHLNTQKLVNEVLAKFRTIVVDIEHEHKELDSKLKQLELIKKERSLSVSSSSTTATTTGTNLRSSTTQCSSTGGEGTLSSPLPTESTNTTANKKPPPYKSAVKYNTDQSIFLNNNNLNHIVHNKNNKTHHIRLDLPPDPPIRRRRRNKTVDLINSLNNRFNNMNIMAQRGALIVLEGLDRVGKSTLASKLVEHLENVKKPVAHFRFPDRSTPTGQLIDSLLKDSSKKIDNHAMHLLFSANRWELDKKIRQTVLNGTTVIIDRYSYSGIAYSVAKGDLDINWCRDVEKGLPKPDLIIYLELRKEYLYKRPGFGGERFEVEEFQELIRHEYDLLIKSTKQDNWLRINVENKGPECVLGECILPIKRCLESCANKPLENLEF